MNNDQNKSIQNELNQKINTSNYVAAKVDNNQASQDQKSQTENDMIAYDGSNDNSQNDIQKQNHKKMDRPLKIFGGICIALFVVAMIFSANSSINTSDAAKDALTKKVSTSLAAGTILLANDENIGQQDYTITHKYDKNNTKIKVWDYAAEDGDYVQVLVNGSPITDAFMIKHKPVEITVPAVGEVQIKGILDGGGGITYAVRYDLNGMSYFNSAPEGEFNTYTLIRE